MKIYADFNGVEPCGTDGDELCLDLTGFGTLASLCRHSVKLHRGLCLTFSDFDGLVVTAAVDFDSSRVGPNSAGWYAKFRKADLREEEAVTDYDFNDHPCFKCRINLKPHFAKVGQQFHDRCPNCGTPVLFPLSAPDV